MKSKILCTVIGFMLGVVLTKLASKNERAVKYTATVGFSYDGTNWSSKQIPLGWTTVTNNPPRYLKLEAIGHVQ